MSWKVYAKSVEGTSHIASGIPCQDSVKTIRLSTTKGDFLILIAADGCGSSKHSDVGSELVTSEVSGCLAYWVGKSENMSNLSDLIIFAFGHANQMLSRKAKELSIPIRELASTCLCSVIGPNTFAAAQIGDGVIVRQNNGVSGCLFWPNQEYSNVTHTLIDKDWYCKTQVYNSSWFDDLADCWFMATDGIQDIACDSKNRIPHPGFVSVLFDKFAATQIQGDEVTGDSLDSFLRSKRINAVVNDDKTIVLACR